MDNYNMEFNNNLITLSTPTQIFSNSSEKHSSKNGEHGDSHILKIEKYIKGKCDEVALDHLRQKTTDEVTAKTTRNITRPY